MSLRPRYPLLFFVALVAAFMLWYFEARQRRERISVRSVKAPINLVSIPSDLVLMSAVPEPVTIQVSGPLSAPLDFNASIELDVSRASPDRTTYQIRDTEVRLPQKMTVVSIDPREITLEFERLEVVSIPVRPVLEGLPAPGFDIATVRVFPSQIRVQGPGSHLAELQDAPTVPPVIVEGATGSIEATVEADLPRPLRALWVDPILIVVEILPAVTPTPTPVSGR